MANELHKENSPYLLQHANNPVHWKAWSQETLSLARSANKPILISVGYAACHWCHVMEAESFEDPEVAGIMNRYFVNIKVDREERPDVDQLYMTAVQIMTGSGGWPMHVVALPDGRPFWGGTYFKKEQWMAILKQLGELYKSDLPKIEEYAGKLTEGISLINTNPPSSQQPLPTLADIRNAIAGWIPYMDMTHGGRKGAPKFMMPVNLNFLLKYSDLEKDSQVDTYLKNTLLKMPSGGLWDHLGGGFARYSTDEKWHIPHFEMMLYDNAQLLKTYALAYRKFRDPFYLEIMEGIFSFLIRDLLGENGEFYSSLDADSINAKEQLQEGAYYTWTKEELEDILKEDFEVFSKVFNINAKGYWEHGNYVLFREDRLENLSLALEIPEPQLRETLESCRVKLLKQRSKRPRPSLDDKCITSWNALTITGLTHAYLASGEEKYLELALRNMKFLEEVMIREDIQLSHTYRKGRTGDIGFLEDYAFLIEACITLFQAGCGHQYILRARYLCNHVLDNFFDEKQKMFLFSAHNDCALISNPVEKSDNVIPASNSVMAKNLFTLGAIFGNEAYNTLATQMLGQMREDFMAYPYSHANWLDLALNYEMPFREVAVTGPGAIAASLRLQERYLSNTLVIPSETSSSIAILKNRYNSDRLQFFICKNQQCDLPVHTLEECIKQLEAAT
ncbi:thioredoxin domain-containing protein [Robertkochia flava]|uniref:thioredoxin domain-containing protein n=1 Tax=Robertkochia flava TaxID=3447986 RepID=UPI001CCC1F69|nr:thioredoxin domain-containing protein [Robertkochia marina]